MTFFNFDRRMLRNMDWLLLICVAILVVLSVFMVYSASYSLPSGNYLRTQLIAIVISFAGFMVASVFDYAYLQRFDKTIYIVMLLLLAAVFVIGREGDYGGKSWIDLGPLSFQPAELAKVLLVLFLSVMLDSHEAIDTVWPILKVLCFVAVPMVLILMQPDLGSATVFIVFTAALLFIYGVPTRYLLSLVGIALVSFPFLWLYGLEEYQRERLLIFLDPEAHSDSRFAWQIIQSIIATGSGGMYGRGYMQGTQTQLSFLPESQSDFIFSTIAEELGFVGGAFVIIIYLLMVWRILSIARTSKDRLGQLICVGIAAIFLYHLLINIGMAIGVMPVIGIPLPLVSYANSSLISMMLGLGVVISVALRRAKTIF